VMLTLAALGMGLALWWISDTDFTLETGQ